MNKLDTDKILKQVIPNYMESCAKNVAKDAKARAPVDTGKLRDSITYNKTGEYEYQIGSDVEYAIFQELGTVKLSAQPFLRPSLQNKMNYKI